MASSFTLPILKGSLLHKSHFLGQTHLSTTTTSPPSSTIPTLTLKTTAKFNLFEILGGRGLCNGEEGLEKELKKTITTQEPPPPPIPTKDHEESTASTSEIIPENAFEKELQGLTGGFPGGEKGLQQFIEKNPPPPKRSTKVNELETIGFNQSLTKKPKPPELPLLMPGMIAIVKNPNNPYYMYCGIVQRITDGKAGVLFEGGNWDRLITFRLDELERREKGPPMVSPRQDRVPHSAIFPNAVSIIPHFADSCPLLGLDHEIHASDPMSDRMRWSNLRPRIRRSPTSSAEQHGWVELPPTTINQPVVPTGLTHHHSHHSVVSNNAIC